MYFSKKNRYRFLYRIIKLNLIPIFNIYQISNGTRMYIDELREYCNSSGPSKVSSDSLKDLSDYEKDSSNSSKVSNENDIDYIFLSDSDDESQKIHTSPNKRDHFLQLNHHSIFSSSSSSSIADMNSKEPLSNKFNGQVNILY